MLSFYLAGLKKIVGWGKKILLVIIVYFIIFGLFAYFFNKDKPKPSYDPIKKNRQEIYRVINDPELNKTKEGKLQATVMRLTMCGLLGEACTENPSDGDKYFSKSLFGFVSSLFVIPYANPPASGVWWAYNGLQNAGFVSKTYAAQGIGAASLVTVAPLWDAFRKIAYLVLVLIMVAIGFMIMFRMKLNPQTVIGVENALPRIVIALLLITFSFAIVGFAVDIMYLATIVVVDFIGGAAGITNISATQSDLLNRNVIQGALFDWSAAFWSYLNGLYAILDILPVVVRLIIHLVLGFILFLGVARFGGDILNFVAKLFGHTEVTGSFFTIVGGALKIGDIVAAIISLIFGIVLSIAFLWILIAFIVVVGLLFLIFRIFFLLLSSLIQIILYLIFAPLILLLEAIPGRSAFSSWFRNIIGNLIVFPAVVFLLLITTAITNIYGVNAQIIAQYGNHPPMLTPPLLGGIGSAVIAPLINASLLLMIPDLVKLLKQQIIGKEGFQLPVGPGALFGAAGAVGGSALGMGQQLYYMQMGFGALFGHKDERTGQRTGLFSSIGGAIGKALQGK